MIAWDGDAVMPAAAVRGETGRQRPGAPGTREAPPGPVWRDILLATGLYVAAHALLLVRGEWNQFPSLTGDVAAAQLCFLLGTLLIWRCTRRLCAPDPPLQRTRPRQAACCLALATALSFSPCLWWFVFRW